MKAEERCSCGWGVQEAACTCLETGRERVGGLAILFLLGEGPFIFFGHVLVPNLGEGGLRSFWGLLTGH